MNSIEENKKVILKLLSKWRDEKGETNYFKGDEIADETGLSSTEINDAVTILAEAGYLKWRRALGTAPYRFAYTQITPKGRYLVERISSIGAEKEIKTPIIEKPMVIPPIPAGSPYGFTVKDWSIVAENKAKSNVLIVVLGYQEQSKYYDSNWLKKNIRKMFEDACEVYSSDPDNFEITLDFRPLEAGYGEHLFNQIARDIISADIAVFETSDKNTNVYLEMGVAQTWGVAVLPIKKAGTEKPTSDISGQTYADYVSNGQYFVIKEKVDNYPKDPNQQEKLLKMIDRAIRKKIT